MTAPAVLDLFSGACGGWSLGMHRAGFRTVAACEADPWRRAVFSHNFPDARMYDDVRTLTASRIVSDLGALPEVIVGSPPCQDASAANTKGRGVDGERTGLFFEAIRLVGECRPRWAAFENVPGLRNRGADRVLGALEALGYAAEAHVVGASDVGANHERKRVWIIAFDPAQVGHERGRAWRRGPHGDSAAHPARGFVGVGHNADEARQPHGQMVAGIRAAQEPDNGCASGWGDAWQVCSQPYESRQSNGAEYAEVGGRESFGGIAQEPWAHWNGGLAARLRVDDGLSAKLAEHRGLAGAVVAAFGDAVCPQIAEAIGRSIWRVEAALSALTGPRP